MKNKSLILASLAVAAVLSAGCEKEKNYDEIRVSGEPIRFSAQTSYENGDGTRTEYSGALYGTTDLYERIDWLENDPMKIIYVQGSAESFANYKVTDVSGTTDENSYADVAVDGSELVWGSGSGANKFYAMYPTHAKNSYASLEKTGSNYRATGTLLPTQDVDASKTQTVKKNLLSWTRYQPDMDYNYLLAYADDNIGITGGSVRLPFRPAVTAFEFRFQRKNGDSDRKVTKFELSSSSDALTGEFKIDITGGNLKGATWNTLTAPTNVPARTTANSVITVNFPTGGVSLPEEGYLDFTVFALPSDLHNLTMRLTYADGKHASLPLNNKSTGQPYVFTGARKYIITNSNVPGVEGWHYVIEEIDDITYVGHDPVYPIGYNVKSYKWNDREGQDVKYKVAWKTQYSLDGTTWTDVANTGAITGSDYSVENGAITGTGVNTSTYSTGEARNARLSGSTTATVIDGGLSAQAIIDELKSRTAKSDYDLSMYDIYGNSHAQTTANSYVVTAPGTYKFPVVYGNAITNGTDFVESYYPGIDGTDIGAPGVTSQLITMINEHKNTNTFRYLTRFRSATNNPISKPNIVDDFNFWESETVKAYGPSAAGQYIPGNLDAAIVWQNSMELPGETTGHAIVQESSVYYDNGYIYFTVAKDDIRPGNAVIAFRGTVGNKITTKSILWSWQIWVTANDLTPVELPNGKLMPFNLGYIDSTPSGSEQYPNREIQFRIVQVEDGVEHEIEPFKVEQRGDGHTWDASVGFNVYYQWGRKDPMIPAKDYGAQTLTPPSPATGTREVYPDATYVAGTGYTINVQGNDIAGGYYNPDGNTDPDFASGIQHPYYAYLNTRSTGWVGGYDNGYFNNGAVPVDRQSWSARQKSAIPVNLWNNGMYTTMNGNNNRWKTVYDPCPPGFSVPTIGVFSSLTDETAIGEPTTEGRYFQALNGGRIFLPFSGLRCFYNKGNGTAVLWAEQVRQGGFYWTDSTLGAVENANTEDCYSKHFGFSRTEVNTIVPIHVHLYIPTSSSEHTGRGYTDYTRGSSLAIRPMVYTDPRH